LLKCRRLSKAPAAHSTFDRDATLSLFAGGKEDADTFNGDVSGLDSKRRDGCTVSDI
jgi:hypothetical protein